MGVLSILDSVVKPVTDLIDSFVTSDEEKAEAKAKLQMIENDLTVKILEYESKLVESQKEIINSEAKGESWLQRNWRPITMMAFLFLLFLYWFGVQPDNLSQETLLSIFDLLKIGIGGYIVSRGVEKGLKTLKNNDNNFQTKHYKNKL